MTHRAIGNALKRSAPVLLGLLALACLALPAASGAGREPNLAAEANTLAASYQRKFGEGYTTRIDNRRHLVYVSALDENALGHVVRLLGAYADAQQRLLFPDALQWNVAVVLPTLSDYRRGGPPDDTSGYYNPATRTLTSISMSNVLIHEFTHALHHADQVRAGQRHPVWISEGLATLFQCSRVEAGRIEVLQEASLVGLQEWVRQKKALSLADLCTIGREAFVRQAMLCYPEVHYLMLYVHRQDKLEAFYETYKSRYASDPTGAKALEATLGKPLGEIETDWQRWVLALEPPWRPAHLPVAQLGIRMRRAPEGVQVDGFLPGSAAQRAGVLKVNDIILSVAGQPTPTARDLAEAVDACKPGEIVDIEVVRREQTLNLKHVLGATRP